MNHYTSNTIHCVSSILSIRTVFIWSLSTVAGGDSYMPGQMPSGGMQEMYGRPPSGMGQRSQYPYGPGYDRR